MNGLVNSTATGSLGLWWALWVNRSTHGFVQTKGNLYSTTTSLNNTVQTQLLVPDMICYPQLVASATNLTINGRFASAGAVIFQFQSSLSSATVQANMVTVQSSQPEAVYFTVTGIQYIKNGFGGIVTDTVVLGSANTSISWAAGVVTVATPVPHQISGSASVIIAGVTPSGYNGTYTATVTGASSFTYPLASNPGAESVLGVWKLAVAQATGTLFLSAVTQVTSSGACTGYVQVGGSLQQRTFFLSIPKSNAASNVSATAALGYTSGTYNPLLTFDEPSVSVPGTTTSATLPNNALTILGNSNVMNVNWPSHGLIPNQYFYITGATGVGGLLGNNQTSGTINTDVVTDANNIQYVTSALSNMGGPFVGGGSAIMAFAFSLTTQQAPASALPFAPTGGTGGGVGTTATFANHGLLVGESVIVWGPSGWGSRSPANVNGTYTVTGVIDVNTFTYNTTLAYLSGNAGGQHGTITPLAPIVTTNGSGIIAFRWQFHGFRPGETCTFAGFSAVGGITTGQINTTLTCVGAGVQNATVAYGGTGYTNGSTITFSNSGTGTIAVTGGVITGVTITAAGAPCTSPPTVSSIGGGGSGALIFAGIYNDNIVYFQTAGTATSTAAGGGSGTAVAHRTMTAAQHINLCPLIVTSVTVDAATAGNITVGGLTDGATAVCPSQNPTGAGSHVLTLTGGGPVTLTTAQQLTIASSANDSARTFTVVGTNSLGQSITFTMTGPNATTAIQLNYNPLLASLQNAPRCLIDIVPLPDQAMTTSLAGIVGDYEPGDDRTTAQTTSIVQSLAGYCHGAALKAFKFGLFIDPTDASSQSRTGIATPTNIDTIYEAVDFFSPIVYESASFTILQSLITQWDTLAYSSQDFPQKFWPDVSFQYQDLTSLAAAQAAPNGGNLTLTGIQPALNFNDRIIIFCTGDASGATITITPGDSLNPPETFTGPKQGYVVSSNLYDTTPASINVSGPSTGLMSAGYTLGGSVGTSLQGMINVRQQIEAYGFPAALPQVAANPTYGSNDPNTDFNQKIAILGMGSSVPRPLLVA